MQDKMQTQVSHSKHTGRVEANRKLSESLTPELLQNSWIEAIKESGNAIVVPEWSTTFVSVDGSTN